MVVDENTGRSWAGIHCQHQALQSKSAQILPFFPQRKLGEKFVTYSREKSEFLLQSATEEVPKLSLPLLQTDIEKNIGGSTGIEASRNALDFFGHWSFFKQHFEEIQVKKMLFTWDWTPASVGQKSDKMDEFLMK